MRAIMVAVELVSGVLEAAILAVQTVVGLPFLPLSGLHLGDDGSVLVAAVDDVTDVDDLTQGKHLAAAQSGRQFGTRQTVELLDEGRGDGSRGGLQRGRVVLIGEVMGVPDDDEGNRREGRHRWLIGRAQTGGDARHGR